MGQIDVTDILADPDFTDPVTIIHRLSSVDQFGANQLSERSESTLGVVQPASGKTLARLPEAYRVGSVMSFWVQGKIVSDGSCQYPDILVHKCQRYQVQTIMDWTNWGSGWCEGTAVREKPST